MRPSISDESANQLSGLSCAVTDQCEGHCRALLEQVGRSHCCGEHSSKDIYGAERVCRSHLRVVVCGNTSFYGMAAFRYLSTPLTVKLAQSTSGRCALQYSGWSPSLLIVG